MHDKKRLVAGSRPIPGLWTQWAVSRLPKRRLGTSSLCLKCSVFTTDSQILNDHKDLAESFSTFWTT